MSLFREAGQTHPPGRQEGNQLTSMRGEFVED
jgi:hypothetical protein